MIQAAMASSSSNPNINQTVSSFTFTNPIKLDRSNYTIWKSQILSTIRANGLESLLDGTRKCPNQFHNQEEASLSSDRVTVAEPQENPEFNNWKRQDQLLLSWLMSSISVEILSLVVNSNSSNELWTNIEEQFGSETGAKKVHLKMLLNNLKKGSMTITEYFSKLKAVSDELALAGIPVTNLDFITPLICGLGQPYYPVVVYIEANMLKMSVNEAYSMLLTHEARIESNQQNANKEAKLNYTANMAQTGPNKKFNGNTGGGYGNWNQNANWNGNNGGRGGYNNNNGGGFGNWNQNVNWNGNNGGRGGYNSNNGGRGGFGRGVTGQGRGNWSDGNHWNNGNFNRNYSGQGRGDWNDSGNGVFGQNGAFNSNKGAQNSPAVICQICFKPRHTAAECRNRFNKDFTPAYPPSNFNPYQSNTKAAFLTTSEGGLADQGWYLDSGATHHLTNNLQNLNMGMEYSGNQLLHVGNGEGLNISHIGYACFHTSCDSLLHLNDILYVPAITKNLISISTLLKDNDITIEFVANLCFIKDKKKTVHLAQGIAKEGLYQLLSKDTFLSKSCSLAYVPRSMIFVISNSASVLSNKAENKACTESVNSKSHVNITKSVVCGNLLHQRLGHPNKHALKNIIPHLSLKSSITLPDFCDACQYGKLHQLSFYSTGIKTSVPLELIHTDLWGPSPMPSFLHGYRYYISFVDDYTRYCWIFPLTFKSEALETFQNFKTLVEKQFNLSIKSVQSDWGGEFRSFVIFLQQEGISFRHSCPHTHHQNGVVERKHRHIVETGLTLLAQAQMPLSLWWESFHTASFLVNRLPTPVLNNISPFEKLHNRKPDYQFLKTFGCSCFPLLKPYNKHKLSFHTQKCLMIGYSPIHKGYKCLDPTGKVYVARNIQFNESEFPYTELFTSHKTVSSSSKFPQSENPFAVLNYQSISQDSSSTYPSASIPDSGAGSDSTALHTSPSISSHSISSTPPPTNTEPCSTHHPSTSTQTQISPLVHNTHSMVTRSKAGIFKPKSYLAVSQELEPTSVKLALSDPKWKQAMQAEFDALQVNETWELVPKEAAQKIIGNKWVFRIKYNPDGSISKHKARLVAKGFHQTPGVDFFETYSPVVKPCTIRVILSLAVMNHWPIRQLDVNNAFLNGILSEEVFMSQPEGFLHPQFPTHVCKLKKALYGLKQAPRAWYEKLKSSMLQWGFHTSRSDTSLFIQHTEGELVVVIIYVDDILVTGSHTRFVERIVHQLGTEYALKDLGEFNYFLGLEVTPSLEGLHLSQTKYIGDLLRKAQMLDSKGCQTPMSSTEKLTKDKGTPFENPSLYRSIVGSLQYVILTRPEIAFSVNKLSQFLTAPSVFHWQACKRVLRYLQLTANYGLQFYHTGKLTLTAFSDADWGSDLDDRKSIGGYCVYLGNNLISWSSKKQQIVSRSTAESEYRALALTTSEVLWITYLFKELQVQLLQTPELKCDNKSAEALASNPKYHSKTKHIELDLHFIREHVARKEVEINHVPSCEQVADILTKPLAVDQFNYLRSKLNVLPRP
ncbi:retrovirus-related pol polyprotein from transposon RE1 [Citrus sinensis]|nr:retrovirus-related pol polyprotein from transposon RE1 [Citrus sinensis]